jgi:site-specific recombinase XerD
VDEYGDYLTEIRGVAPKTRRAYSSCAAGLLAAKFGDAPANVSHLSVADLAARVLHRGQTCSMKEARQTATALRSFARFLHVAGHCGPELGLGVPSPSVRRPSKVPEVLGDDQVSALLAAFDRTSATGQRGYAMTMCLVVLGLRSCEVPDLSLDDIDWRGAAVRITRGKSRRASTLPLPKEVGDALVGYLTGGRPATTSRRVFVRHSAPRGAPLTASAVRIAIRRAFERAGVEVPSKGTHILRRTAATRMMRGGASVKEVADVLRHRSIDTTVLYARMELHALAEVAMPWPEVRS